MFNRRKVEVLVVGAGPSGIMAALCLARQGIEVAIVDAADRGCARCNALALHPGSLRLLDRMGIAARAIDLGYRIDKVLIYDEDEPRETINLNELPVAFPYALALPQSDLEVILEEELERAGVSVLWNHRASGLDDSGASETVVEVDRYSERGTGYAVAHTERLIDKTYRYEADLVIAADGYNSLMRRLTKAATSDLGPPQFYAFFEFDTDMDPQRAVRISFKDKLATAQYPILGGAARLSFEFLALNLPDEYRNKERRLVADRMEDSPEMLDDRRLEELIASRVPWITGGISRVRYRAVAPYEKRCLKSPARGRVFFLGDAARSFGPLSMTSLNLGLLEAEQLASAYAQECQAGRGARELDALGLRMAEQWQALANIERHAAPIDLADPWVALHKGRILRSLPATGEALERLASQLFLHVSLSEMVEV